MNINVTHEQYRVPVTVLHLDGDLAAESYEEFVLQAMQEIDAGTTYMLVDMTHVPYMSSAGIRAINQIFGRLRSLPQGEDEAALHQGLLDGSYKSRRLKLAHLSDQVKKTLTLAGIDMFIDIQPDMNKALAAF